MGDALLTRERHEIRKTAAAAVASGEIHQTPDGNAGYYSGLEAAATNDPINMATDGQVVVPKTASVAILDGGKVYWDHSANAANFKPVIDRDFYIGTAVGDAAAADTTMTVNLNVEPVYAVELGDGDWTTEATLGLGVTELVGGSIVKAEFDAVAEAAQAAIYPAKTFAAAANPIFECKMGIFDIGDDAALDINCGLANATHATDADSITESCFVHFDGAALDILAESDDGTTEVAATDTTVNAVDDTYFEAWIDCRDLTDIQIYIDGVLVLGGTTFKLNAASGPLFPILHVEKTSNDTTADVRLEFMRVRTQE